MLAQLGEKYDFTAEGVPLLVADGVTISSTYIREQLAVGDVAAAARALGRPHRVEGVVVRGHMRGRGLGFPTANLETPPHTATPADGVYAGWLTSLDLDGAETARWPAAISVGTNPTFGIGDRTVEAYALDRDDLDLYGVHAAIDFTARLRGTERFDSVQALITQMHEDVAQARALTGGSQRSVERPLEVVVHRHRLGRHERQEVAVDRAADAGWCGPPRTGCCTARPRRRTRPGACPAGPRC